jgi:hypothetical protein
MCGEEPSRYEVLPSGLNSGINWIGTAPGLASVPGQKKGRQLKKSSYNTL